MSYGDEFDEFIEMLLPSYKPLHPDTDAPVHEEEQVIATREPRMR